MYLNAALIREIRMVYQHLTSAFGGRTPASRFDAPRMVLQCSHCFLMKRKKPKPAVMVLHGQSVCEEHAH